MLSTCLFCRRALPRNDVIEHFPVGRRVAFDPVRGRLWAVCPACARWTLAPLEERWEALEELEKLTRDGARLLAQTDNIALLRAAGVEIVRVGRADLGEEAWWRFGAQMRRRRTRTRVLGLIDYGMVFTVGIFGVSRLVREATFVGAGWRGERTCQRCGAALAQRVSARGARGLFLRPDDDGGVRLEKECPRCAWQGERGVLVWRGADARAILRAALAYENFSGATAEQVQASVRRIEASGGAAGYLADLGCGQAQLREFHSGIYRVAGLAFEMALNDDVERRLLEGELQELESEWHEAEEVAAIVDRELTPLPRPLR